VENPPCDPPVKGKSLDNNKVCSDDCASLADATVTVNVPGYHSVDSKCTKDSATWVNLSAMVSVAVVSMIYM